MKSSFKKKYNKDFLVLSIITTILLVISIIMTVVIRNDFYTPSRENRYLDYGLKPESANTPVWFDITRETYHLKDNYYLVRDDVNIFIVKLSESENKRIKSNNFKENKTYRIYGYTKDVTDPLVDKAIVEINGLFEEEILNKANYFDYMGFYYVDQHNVYLIQVVLAVAMGILLIFSSTFIILYFQTRK